MRYLVDSDWVADWLQGKQDAIDLLSRLEPDGLAISAMVYGEIYEGIYYGHQPNSTARPSPFHLTAQDLQGWRVRPVLDS